MVSRHQEVYNSVAAYARAQAEAVSGNMEIRPYGPGYNPNNGYNSLTKWDIDAAVRCAHKAHKAAVLLQKMYNDEISADDAAASLAQLRYS